MKEVNFYRGKKNNYVASKYPDGIYFATDKGEILLDNVSYGSVTVDNVVTAGGTNPVSGAAVSKAIPERVNAALLDSNFITGVTIANTGGNLYEISTIDAKGNYNSVGTIQGEASNIVREDRVLFYEVTGTTNKLIKSGEEIIFTFKYDYIDSNNNSYFYNAKIRVLDSASNIISEYVCSAGGLVEIIIPETPNMVGKSSQFIITATPINLEGVELSEKSTSVNVQVTVIHFTMVLSGYNLDKTYSYGDIIQPEISFEGYLGKRTVFVYIDNDSTKYYEYNVNEGSTNLKFDIDVTTNNFAPEVKQHNLLIVSYYETTDKKRIFSDLIYIALPIKSEIASFGAVFTVESNNGVILGVNDIPSINVNQYESFSFDFNAYSSLNINRTVEFYSESTLVSDYSLSNTYATLLYKYNTIGDKICYLECEGQKLLFNVNVIKSSQSISTPSNMSLYLTPEGKSNLSNSKNVWNYKNITSTFEGFNWNSDGWLSVNNSTGTEPALRLISGDKVTINHKLFENSENNSSNAFTFLIRFRASSVADDTKTLISCFDGNTGFKITGSEAIYTASQGSTISTKFAPEEIYSIGFTVFLDLGSATEANKLNSKQMFLYVNGVMSGNGKVATTEGIYQNSPTDITIHAQNCILDIFSIKCYNYALSENDMFSSYLIDLNNPQLMKSEYDSNLLLDNGNISLEKALGCGIPCVLITGTNIENGIALNAVDYVAALNTKDPKYDVEEILYLETKEASERNFLAIRKNGPESKWSITDGKEYPQLRLLGTSSMNYPIKNFRIYTKNSKMFLNASIDDLYRSIEAIETLETEGSYIIKNKPKYALRENSVPVNCWCLKADFAESSSSHNTGFAKLVHDTSIKLNSLTPPQRDKSEDYPYEVRTTIDGYPCLLFSRKTTSDTPVFRGKYNFNNDKSTEEVFGFVGIDGYHDGSEELIYAAEKSLDWVGNEEFLYKDEKGNLHTLTKSEIIAELAEEIGSNGNFDNPVECWEFKNNENEFGDFKNVDFNNRTVTVNEKDGYESYEYKWLNMWEARFPDIDNLNIAFERGVVKPKYLETVALWIMSTDTSNPTGDLLSEPKYGFTHDTAEYRKAKFSNELKNYFNVNFLCLYYMLNDMVAGADQRKKNMMWAFWYDKDVDGSGPMGKMRCYVIYYDNDTILGVDNSGKITVPWDADENTITGTAFTFAGHNSVLWKNLRDNFLQELKSTYRLLRNVLNNEQIKSYFNTQQSEVYGEITFNKDSIYKYIRPDIIGTAHKDKGILYPEYNWGSFSDYIQGTRKAHRDWFINKRLNWFDNKYAADSFVSSIINFKGGIGYKPYFTYKTVKDAYYAVSGDNVNMDSTHIFVKRTSNENYDYKYEFDALPGPGATFNIHGCDNMEKLDVSHWGGFNLFNIGVTLSNLKTFILGSIDYAPIIVSNGIEISSSRFPQLEYLDVSNMLGADGARYVSADLSNLLYLETFIATGCSYLTTASFASGGNLERIVLPENFQNLYLINLPKLNIQGIEWGSCQRPLWDVIVDENGNSSITKTDQYEDLKASYASIKLLHVENCSNIDGMKLLNIIADTEGSQLQAARIVGVSMSGNGLDLIKLYKKNLLGLQVDSKGVYTQTKDCTILGTYKLTKLWIDGEEDKQGITLDELRNRFKGLDIQQPEYTMISFNCAQATSEKVTNYDNSTGYEFGNDYKYSGHIAKILDQRHSYLVKYPISYPSGEFAAIQLDDNDSNKFTDGTTALLDGTYGDFCMYEPHYWYKGVNDHKKLTLYLLFSSNKECPKQANGKKVAIADCVLRSGYGASTGNQYLTDSQSIVAQLDYNLYSYVLPEGHKYKQFRVSSVTSANYGCIVVDKNGNIKQRLSQAGNAGMYDTSYLFDSLHPEAYKIYMTINKNTIPEYCLYLTESSDTEAIEPDWVEHKECFVGRVFSTLYEGEVKSAIYNNISPENWATTGFYPQVSGLSVRLVNNTISSSGKGYYAADYEVFKDIINLAYARYGSTGLHSNHVGAGADANGKFDTYYISRYFPNPNVKSTEYGINDTVTDQVFESYYSPESDVKEYPGTATLMGYYHFVGQGSMTSYLDKINMSTKMFSNERTGRTLKLYTGSSAIYNKSILGGRYFDIFGSSSQYGATSSNDGFCGREYTTNNNITTALVSIGYRASSTGVLSYNLLTTDTERANTSTNISYNDIINAQRILIIPDKVTYFNTISEYNSL